MKRICLLLCACFLFNLCACGLVTEGKETGAQPEIAAPSENVPAETQPPENQLQETQPQAPQPTEPDYEVIDTEMLKAIEASDRFSVRVIKQEKVKNALGTGASVEGNDAFVFTVENESGKKITSVSLLVLATDKNGEGYNFLGNYVNPQLTDMRYSAAVRAVGFDIELKNGEVCDDFVLRCSFDAVENMNVIVYSYTDADGNEFVNAQSQLWLANTLPQ